MPCSDGVPPAWVDEARRSDQYAATMLCVITAEIIKECGIPALSDASIAWYFNHRVLDLAKAQDRGAYGTRGAPRDEASIKAITDELRLLEAEITKRQLRMYAIQAQGAKE